MEGKQATRTITIDYEPRDVFWPYHARKQRWSCIVAHRRCGKTVACINDLIAKAAFCKQPHGRYAYVAPFLSQAKDVAWEYIKRFAEPLIASKNESELWVELITGARIRLYGADNPDRLRGGYLDGVVLDEFADMRSSLWGEIVRPMLADRMGWATFIGTPKGHNEFAKLFERAKLEPETWYSAILRASETKLLAQTELDAAKQDMTPEQYEQEFECSFEAAIIGAYFGKEMAQAERDGRITSVPYEPALPVHTSWDLGIGESTAIWFWQIVGNEIRIIDHYENHGQALSHYADVIYAKDYGDGGQDWVPHDAKVRELGTGRTRVETLDELGLAPTLVPDHKIGDGINAVRLLLKQCWFDRDKCSQGLEALRQYRSDWDDKARTFKDTPRHDWTSHSADAFRYMCMAYKEIVPDPVKPPPRFLQELTLDELWDMQAKRSGRGARI